MRRLKAWFRAWLEILQGRGLDEHRGLLVQLRADLDKDAQEVARIGAQQTDVIAQLNRNTQFIASAVKRLAHYEHTVPAIAGSYRGLVAAEKKAERERQSGHIPVIPRADDVAEASEPVTG